MSKDRLPVIALALVPFAACAVIYWPTLSGAFLSDDYSVLGALWDWSSEGHLLSTLISKFHVGLDSPSFYYRPLSMASFGVDFAVAGADPLAWRLTNLAAHLASGVAVFVLVRRMSIGREAHPEGVAAPAIATAVFLLFPTSPEAVAWVSGRYDLLALAFMLVTIALFLRSSRWHDRWGLAALLAAACALASKESAALLPVLVAAVAVARRAATPRTTPTRNVVLGVRDALPWILLAIGYFALRTAIFGNPFQVYAGTSPVAAIVTGAWTQSLGAAGAWVDASLPLPILRALFLMAIIALLVVGTVASWRRGGSRSMWFAVAISAFASVGLLLPHVSALATNGEQGRLFYTTSALLGLLCGLAVAATTTPSGAVSKRGLRATAFAASLVLVTAELFLLRATVAPWSSAGAQARSLIAALPDTASKIPSAGYGFVLVPDHLASVPFGRNAQGGLMQPPTQPFSLSSRLIVQTPVDLPAWPKDARRGLVDALRRYPLSQVWTAVASGQANGTALPTDYYCWSERSSRIVEISVPPSATQGEWLDAWRGALAASPCAEDAMELGAR